MTARQPGIAFVSPATSIAEALPRMDIACFVGFAARGPVHEPVAVESAEHYGRVFGGGCRVAGALGAHELLDLAQGQVNAGEHFGLDFGCRCTASSPT